MVRRGRDTGRKMRRCFVAGCGRWVQVGDLVCRDHKHTREGRELEAAVGRAAALLQGAGTPAAPAATATESASARERGRAEAFRRRLARGDFGELLDAPVQAMVTQVGDEGDLKLELGSLRVAVTRMLMEEDDPAAMALGLTRLARARVLLLEKLEKLRLNVDDEFMEIWDELDAETEEERQERLRRWELEDGMVLGGVTRAGNVARQAESDREALARMAMEGRVAHGMEVDEMGFGE